MKGQSVNFKISYDGPAVESGSMPVRDLAPALMSLSQLFEDVNREVQEQDVDITLRFTSVGKGSFEESLPCITSSLNC